MKSAKKSIFLVIFTYFCEKSCNHAYYSKIGQFQLSRIQCKTTVDLIPDFLNINFFYTLTFIYLQTC